MRDELRDQQCEHIQEKMLEIEKWVVDQRQALILRKRDDSALYHSLLTLNRALTLVHMKAGLEMER